MLPGVETQTRSNDSKKHLKASTRPRPPVSVPQISQNQLCKRRRVLMSLVNITSHLAMPRGLQALSQRSEIITVKSFTLCRKRLSGTTTRNSLRAVKV